MRGAVVAVGVAVLCSGTAWAEERSPYPTSFSVVGGLTAGTSQTVGRQLFGLGDAGEGSGFAVGGDIAHDLSPRLTFELTGLYMDRSSNAWTSTSRSSISTVSPRRARAYIGSPPRLSAE